MIFKPDSGPFMLRVSMSQTRRPEEKYPEKIRNGKYSYYPPAKREAYLITMAHLMTKSDRRRQHLTQSESPYLAVL
jgi:hypothetical protein